MCLCAVMCVQGRCVCAGLQTYNILCLQNVNHRELMTESGSVIIANVKEILIYQVNKVHILAQK